jgi:rare lipoprotein A (peptidoglycan hydrolase)
VTREQRIVTLAFLALAAIVVLALAGRVTASPPTPIGQLSERMFEPVEVSASRSAVQPAADSLSVLGRRSGRPTGAPTSAAATPIPGSVHPDAEAAARTDRQPTASPSAAITRGVASWYPAKGFIGAVHSWRWGDDPYPVAICGVQASASVCLTVLVVDYCDACTGTRLIDLSDDAFRVLAPLDAGVVRIQTEGLR